MTCARLSVPSECISIYVPTWWMSSRTCSKQGSSLQLSKGHDYSMRSVDFFLKKKLMVIVTVILVALTE